MAIDQCELATVVFLIKMDVNFRFIEIHGRIKYMNDVSTITKVAMDGWLVIKCYCSGSTKLATTLDSD